MNQNKRGRMVVDCRFLTKHPEAVLRLFAEIGFLPIRINHDEIANEAGDFLSYAAAELHKVWRKNKENWK